MSTKKTETSAAVEEKKSKTDIETRMEAGKVEVMKVVGGIPGAEKLAELIERGKKKGNLSAAELMDVLEDMDLESEQMDKIYDTLENLGIDTVGEDYIPELPDDVEPTIEAIEELPEEDRGPQHHGGRLRHRRPGADVSEGDRQGQPAHLR